MGPILIFRASDINQIIEDALMDYSIVMLLCLADILFVLLAYYFTTSSCDAIELSH